MMPAGEQDGATIHATAVLVGARAVLIRGPAGSGKSGLALRLLQAADAHLVRFARLVGDDRVHIAARHGVLLVRPAAALAGLIEIRGLGLRSMPFEPLAAVGWVVDLAAPDAARLPESAESTKVVSGIRLPRLAVAHSVDPTVPVLTFLCDTEGSPAAAHAPI
jgi:serine kinase of HPr protein (carbohydrate metabolism regulator)